MRLLQCLFLALCLLPWTEVGATDRYAQIDQLLARAELADDDAEKSRLAFQAAMVATVIGDRPGLERILKRYSGGDLTLLRSFVHGKPVAPEEAVPPAHIDPASFEMMLRWMVGPFTCREVQVDALFCG